MSSWPGKYIIGLTGNIGTGKSVVRRMLEHLGAYGIDADALSHRAIAQGSPGYQQVINVFGRWILDTDGNIDRGRLGKVVFSDPQALQSLESIVHPLVRQGIDLLIKRNKAQVVVIEAIKLLEGELRGKVDAVWVAHVDPETQLQRLVERRKMSEAEARQRMSAQPPQTDKLAAANVIIKNGGSFGDTWKQVQAAWLKTIPAQFIREEEEAPSTAGPAELNVVRARPRQASELASLITRWSKQERKLTSEDIMAAFGEKAFLLLQRGRQPVGIAGWQVENLVARIDDFYLDGQVSLDEGAAMLLKEVEAASRELQCEAALLFLRPDSAAHGQTWERLGYMPRTVEQLGVRAWQDAARESLPPGHRLFFHQLRQDRVLRPV